jgi:hypothetical protein
MDDPVLILQYFIYVSRGIEIGHMHQALPHSQLSIPCCDNSKTKHRSRVFTRWSLLKG